MTKDEQIDFIGELIHNVEKEILKHDYPESWDGIELRWLIKEHFDKVVLSRYRDKRLSRWKKFENMCIIKNWVW